MFGELVPIGGGDPIPLLKPKLLVGRRESCDIVLRFANVSSHHCQLTLTNGYWFVKDLNSRNGIKVNGARAPEKRLDPGAVLSVAKHQYTVRYSPADNGAVGPPPPDNTEYDIFSRSLLERAGLDRGQPPSRGKPSGDSGRTKADPTAPFRYDLLDDSANQLAKRRQHNDPL